MPPNLNPRLTKPLAPTWVSRFKEQSLERGRRYARENRVRIAQIGDSLITASCQGSGDNTYRQTIQLRESAKGTLLLVSANCTCPVRTNCKHTAAVLLPADSGAQWLLRSVVFVSQFEWQHWSGCLAARALLCHGISV